MAPTNSNETYCTFTLASDVTAGGLPSEEEIAKDLESSNANVSFHVVVFGAVSGVGHAHAGDDGQSKRFSFRARKILEGLTDFSGFAPFWLDMHSVV
jgi:hypothetical protein